MRHQYRSTVIQAIIRGHKRRVAIRELEALDDRTLRDIGLHRGQIHTVVSTLLNPAPPLSGESVATHNTPSVAANDNEYRSVA